MIGFIEAGRGAGTGRRLKSGNGKIWLVNSSVMDSRERRGGVFVVFVVVVEGKRLDRKSRLKKSMIGRGLTPYFHCVPGSKSNGWPSMLWADPSNSSIPRGKLNLARVSSMNV